MIEQKHQVKLKIIMNNLKVKMYLLLVELWQKELWVKLLLLQFKIAKVKFKVM